MTGVLWALVAGFAVLDWYAVGRGLRRLECAAKPLTMVALAGAAWSMGAGDTGSGRWLLAALVLGLAGDVFLLSDSEARFLAGLAAFLLGHLAYVTALRPLGPQSLAAAAPGVVLVLVLVAVVGRPVLSAIRRQGGAGLSGAVAAYMLVLGAMVVTAWGTARPLVAVGATVFMASDALLARNRFLGTARDERLSRVLVMVTYHAGQALIVLGALR